MNGSFCRADNSKVQLNSKRTVGESVIAHDQWPMQKMRLILSKPQWVFFNAWFGNSFISESRFWKILLLISCYTLQTAQTAKWPCGPIFSSIGYFGGATEVQLSRKGNTARLRSINSSALQLKFRAQAIFDKA